MVDVSTEWILNISVILNATARDSTTVELLITHSLIWEFKGLFNSKFPNSIMHYEQFDCTMLFPLVHMVLS